MAVLTLLVWRQHGLNAAIPRALATTSGASAGGALPVLWNAPTFAYVDQHRQGVTDQSLRGHVWIADFIYTQCTTACPVMTAKMMLLQREATDPQLRFVSFSVDPAHDTPAALLQYAQDWHGDMSRWHLLSTDPIGLRQTAGAMKVIVRATDDPANPIIHSNLFFLVDQQGQVRGVYDSDDDDALHRLVADADRLAGPPPPSHSAPSAPVVTVAAASSDGIGYGQSLFASLGCAACHDQARIAPPVSGLYDSAVRLSDGQTVTANETYLRESIVNPAAKVVAGYSKLMPSYAGHLDAAQIDALIAYLKSVGRNSPSQASATGVQSSAAVASAVDPVCGMSVVITPQTPHAVHDGKTYYFCSDNCQASFEKNPAAYLSKAVSQNHSQ
jgi:protein SCO1/2